MKDLKDLINETLVNETKVNPVDAEAKALVDDVIKKWRINRKFHDDATEAVNQICNRCKNWKVPYPHINDFYTDHDTLNWMRQDYSDNQLSKILVDDNLISVEVNGYGCYNWNNEDKVWEEV